LGAKDVILLLFVSIAVARIRVEEVTVRENPLGLPKLWQTNFTEKLRAGAGSQVFGTVFWNDLVAGASGGVAISGVLQDAPPTPEGNPDLVSQAAWGPPTCEQSKTALTPRATHPHWGRTDRGEGGLVQVAGARVRR